MFMYTICRFAIDCNLRKTHHKMQKFYTLVLYKTMLMWWLLYIFEGEKIRKKMTFISRDWQVMSWCKFCIYIHPVNSKFTKWWIYTGISNEKLYLKWSEQFILVRVIPRTKGIWTSIKINNTDKSVLLYI